TLLRWLKSVGEEVEAGDPIAEIETDKVTLEIEAADAGVLTKTLVGEGQTVPIGTAIATIGEEDGAAAAAPPQPATETAAQAQGTVPPEAEVGSEGETTAKPAEQPMAPAATNGQQRAPAPTNGEAAAAAVAVTRAPGERLRASPLVKRLAAEHGINLEGIPGTGPGGRIVKDDLTPYLTGAKPLPQPSTVSPQPSAPAAAAPTTAPAPAPSPQPLAPAAMGRPAGTTREMSRIRKTTGKRMAESKQVIPHFYVTSEVDMDAAIAFREQVNAQLADDASKVSFNDLIVKAVALALREFPNLNTTLEGDTLYDHANIDVNIAVAIEGGLIAPFVTDADKKSLGTIAREAKDLIKRAREGGLQPHEFQGGTFTISNLGMYDVEEFVAIINPPQAAILAIGSIAETPVVKDGQVVVGHPMKISLSCDHRVSDGAEVARFLIVVKKYLQNPMLLALS
ncbi:MAG TPA: dihydrolipoamide acetyltransferase family protein, partial [Thermomicrobiales bacterium]